MINSLEYVELNHANVGEEVIQEFTCGNPNIDLFFHEKASEWARKSRAVTYILVKKSEIKDTEEHPSREFSSSNEEEKKIIKVFAFATISCAGLLHKNTKEHNVYTSSVEIKFFAIKKSYRGQLIDHNTRYSQLFFKILLQDLYLMSMSIIGFNMIFLQSNQEGVRLYSNCNFAKLDKFLDSVQLPEEDEKIEIEDCIPMGILLNDENCADFFL